MSKGITSSLTRIKFFNIVLQILFDLIFKLIRKFSKLIFRTGESVCIISIHKLGDSIFTFDAVNSIKSFYKKKVYIVCHYNAKDIYALIHPENLIIPIPRERFHFNDRYLDSKARKLLKFLNPEIIIDLTGVMTSASLVFNSNARKIIGMNRKIFRSIYDEFTETDTSLRSNEIYLNAIKKIIPIVPIQRLDRNSKFDIKKILIAPFAGWKSREWGLSKFIRLAEKLSNEYKVEFIFDNTFIKDEIFEYLKVNEIKFTISKSVGELIEKIKTVDLVIGNDSGPIHIAAFLSKATFTIYGPSNPIHHLPEGEKNKFIQKILPCSPKQNERLCFTDGGKNGCPSFECMHLLSVEEVYNNLKSFLPKWH